MALSNLSSAQLAQLIDLIKLKESLQSKLDEVSAKLNALETGAPAPKTRGRRRGRPPGSGNKLKLVPAAKGKKARRGKRLKEPLLKALKSAGASGITVKDLANKLKVKPGNIFSWFYTTGKKISGIKKVGEAKYAMS